MATFTKFSDFAEQLGLGNHIFDSDPIYIFLTNELPLITDTTRADIADLATGGGYTAGGASITPLWDESPAGTGRLRGTDIVWTGTGSGFGPFRYAVMYNQRGGLAGTNKLIGWWAYSESRSTYSGETFTVDFGSTVGNLT